jgi:hypothetical protein
MPQKIKSGLLGNNPGHGLIKNRHELPGERIWSSVCDYSAGIAEGGF